MMAKLTKEAIVAALRSDPVTAYERILVAPLVDRSGELSGPCRLHDDSNLSLRVELPSGSCRCRSCGFRGAEALHLYAAINGLTLPADFWAAVDAVGGLFTESELAALYQKWNAELKRRASERSKDCTAPTQKREKRSPADSLVDLAESFDLFHDGERAYATISVGKHSETLPVRSSAFQGLLRHRYWETEEGAPSAEAISSAMGVLEARARYDGREQPVYLRVANLGDRIIVDLCDAEWRAVEVTASGWSIVATPSVPMRRTPGMRALPAPERGGSLEELRSLLNVRHDADFTLCVSWSEAALGGRGPYPVIVVNGEHGAAKTSTARALRGLVDPFVVLDRAEPRDIRDLMIAARNGHVVSLDNLSHISPWLSDGLCRLSTGGGFATRELYTDEDEVIIEAMRPVSLTGIGELATRADLLDRAVEIYLLSLKNPLDENTYWAAYEQARPRILGVLLDGLVSALSRWDSTRLVRAPRMADFARAIVAAEPGLGWPPGTFLNAYAVNRESTNILAIEASPIAAPVRKLSLPFTGTATELLDRLEGLVDKRTRGSRGWPKTPRALGTALRRIAPNLRSVGIEVTFNREGHDRDRIIRIEPNGTGGHKSTLECSSSSAQSSAANPFSYQQEIPDADGADAEFSSVSIGDNEEREWSDEWNQ
jgi:hypothetical protein